MLVSWIYSLFLIQCFTVCTCWGITVKGSAGQNVTLPCKYDSGYHGICEICWMRGGIPSSGCGSEIIATDGDKVIRKSSEKYQLEGDIQNGDVTLTIHSVTPSDSGEYGCRVHVPGWFNDEKNSVYLVIVQESIATPPAIISDIVTTWPSDHPETPQVTKTWNSAKNISIPRHTKNVIDTMDILPGILASALFLLILGTVITFIMWRQKRKRRTTEELHQNFHDAVIYSNSENSVGLHNRAVDNIYQLDTENEYERWS